LDVGSGSGRLSIPAARRVAPRGTIVALDIQPQMLARLQRRATKAGLTNIITQVSDISRDGHLLSESFDRAWLVTVLGEIPDQANAIRNVYRALKPGGTLTINEIFGIDPHYQSHATVLRLCQEAGFEPTQYWGSWLAYTQNFSRPGWRVKGDERYPAPEPSERGPHLREVAVLFLKLGLIAFGGPAAHIAMMRDEVVKRRKWVDDQHFLDLLGATNLIPGPNSTEMAIHLGFLRAGWAGLIVGGVCFIAPAMLIVLALAWAYVRFGSTPEVNNLLYGIKPVIIAIVTQALWELGKKAVKGPLTAGIGLAVMVLYFFDLNEAWS